MADFDVGEEVVYDGDVYVISARREDTPYRYRLLASHRTGTRFIWADESSLNKMDGYLRSLDDTERY